MQQDSNNQYIQQNNLNFQNMEVSHTGFAPSNYIGQHNQAMPGLSPQMLILPMQMYPNSLYYCQKTPEQNETANTQNLNQIFSQNFRYFQEQQQQYQHQFSNQQFLQQINQYSPWLHQIQHIPTNSSLPHYPMKSQSAQDSQSPSVTVKIEDSDLNSTRGIQHVTRQTECSQVYQQQQQQHQVETDSTTGERSQAAQDDMHVRPTSNTVYQQKSQYEKENLLKIKIVPTLKRSCQTNESLDDAEEPTPSKKVCCVSMIRNTSAMINSNETVKKSVEVVSQFRPKDRQRKSKQDYYNDSNYTKNLLKGFKRYMNRFGEEQEGIVLSEFESFFDKEPLNNELILKCFAHDLYNEAFSNFLSQDPTWWVIEARIKDTDKQIAFFQLCQERNFSSIKTKRKSFQRPLI